jgi:capsular polysaccharide biosynthesis protein
MRPEEIVVAVLRRWWIIVLVTAVAALVAYTATSAQEKTYTVSARVMAIADPPDYWMDLYAKNRLASYRDLISNWEFVRSALETAGADIDPGHAQNVLLMGHNPDSNLIHIVVTDNDPQRAADIVNALADAFVARNAAENARIRALPRPEDTRAPGIVEMMKLDTPTAPTVASGPRVRVNTAAAALLGAIGGLVIAFGLLYLDDTLKAPVDIERYLRLNVLAAVPDVNHRDAMSRASGGTEP